MIGLACMNTSDACDFLRIIDNDFPFRHVSISYFFTRCSNFFSRFFSLFLSFSVRERLKTLATKITIKIIFFKFQYTEPETEAHVCIVLYSKAFYLLIHYFSVFKLPFVLLGLPGVTVYEMLDPVLQCRY